MSEVKRYVTTCDCMSEASWGDYVRHADYARLEQECERLRSALTEISAMQSHEYTIGQNLKDAVRVAFDALSAKP